MKTKKASEPFRIVGAALPRAGVVRRPRFVPDGGPGKGIVPFDANVATIIQGQGPVLTHVHVFLVFWGSQWEAGPVPSVDEVTNAVTRILYGPYMSALAQYEGIGGGVFEGKAVVTSSDPPNPFTTDDVTTFLGAQLLLPFGQVPIPHVDNERLYCVIMPAGVNFKVTPGNDDIGAHSWLPAPFTLKVPYAWIMNDGTLDFVTTVLSHELVESCTDPNPSTDGSLNSINVQSAACPANITCEIADVCQSTGLVCGVRVQSYWSERDGKCIVPKGIISGQVAGIPAIIQSRFLPRGPDGLGNFEMVAALADTGLAHYSRANTADFVPWFGPNIFGTDVGRFDAVSLIQSNFTAGAGIGNLEAAALIQDSLLFYYRDDVFPYTWQGPVTMNGFQQMRFSGNPVLIQGRFVPRAHDGRGNFEMVIPLADGGIAHYSRVNTLPGVPWFGPNVFGTDVGRFDAITMIQSNFTVGANVGDLELVGRVGGDLLFYFREDVPPYTWFGPLTQPGFRPRLFSGNPILIESRFGVGNFELIVPLADGGLAHYFRDNGAVSRPWAGPTIFGTDVGRFDAVTFIQSNFSAGTGIGNFELVARVGEDLLFYWRDDTLASTWYGPCVLVALL